MTSCCWCSSLLRALGPYLLPDQSPTPFFRFILEWNTGLPEQNQSYLFLCVTSPQEFLSCGPNAVLNKWIMYVSRGSTPPHLHLMEWQFQQHRLPDYWAFPLPGGSTSTLRSHRRPGAGRRKWRAAHDTQDLGPAPIHVRAHAVTGNASGYY